MGYFWYSLTS
uniref:Uncharacterized protein n=1 Tax=Arundo donax TaxID=35708 RepID=A0A0A8Z3I2_ARUDO